MKSLSKLQRGTSTTKSSTSPTNKIKKSLKTSIQYVKGVGPNLAKRFESGGLKTVEDLFYFFPKSYEDRSRLQAISSIQENQIVCISGVITKVAFIPLRTRRKAIFEVTCQDRTGQINLKWFHYYQGIEKNFKKGSQITVNGTAKFYRNQPQILHPEVTFGGADSISQSGEPHFGRVIPIYSEVQGINTRLLRKILWNALNDYQDIIQDDLPKPLIEKNNFSSLREALKDIHFPKNTIEELNQFKTSAQLRIIFEEFFKFEFLITRKRLFHQEKKAHCFNDSFLMTSIQERIENLPFQLTADQKNVLEEILNDLKSPHPMNRLLQGDVGCGKTIVALLAAYYVLKHGHQVVLMAPTEILAEQHFLNAKKFLPPDTKILFLSGNTKEAQRNEIFLELQNNQPLFIIGTHALIEDPVQFSKLDFIIIDEQHRFGVKQRLKLKLKGIRNLNSSKKLEEIHPHTLILTATPIPRTLALTVFGDLTVSSIKERPAFQKQIQTKIIYEKQKKSALDFIYKQIQEGRQAYFVYSLIEESEAEKFQHLKSATDALGQLRAIFPHIKIELLHGQMSSQDKNCIMEKFNKNEIQILVSTTVIEVGVDVPNATIIVIENAERFGLSQLHQLRGRVGRGKHQSYCFLMTSRQKSEVSRLRLDTLERTTDGFEIAEVDLEIRGPGEFLGTRQSGDLPFKYAHLNRDKKWLFLAQKEALCILREDPSLQVLENRPLRAFVEREGDYQIKILESY